MKNLLLASTAVGLALFSTAANANDRWYVQGFAGAAMVDTSSATIDEPKNSYDFGWDNTRPGYTVGGAIGYDFGNWRVDSDVSFTKVGTEDVGENSKTLTNGNLHVTALSFNVYRDFPVDIFTHPVEFYVGAGLGAALYDLHDLGVARFTSAGGVEPQGNIQLGIVKSLDEHTAVFVGYRGTYTPSWSDTDGGYTAEMNDVMTHSVLFGIRYTF